MKKHPLATLVTIASAYFAIGVAGFIFMLLANAGPAAVIIYALSVCLTIFVALMAFFGSRRNAFRMSDLQDKFKRKNLLEKKLVSSEDIALNYMPLGMIIYDEAYQIVWANHAAKDFFSNVLIDRKIAVVHEELAKHVETRETRFILDIYDKAYDIYHYPNNRCIYLFEVTERETAKRKLEERKSVLGVMSLDNFNEATSNLDVQDKSNLQGKFLGAIDTWCKNRHIFFVNLRPEKSVIYLTLGQLHELMSEEFQILDTVNEIANQNEVRISLSIGLACYEDEMFDQLGEFAEEALKLAQGRGGDQVVVNIENQPLKFFGGKSNTVEKRTKIIAKINSRAISEFIQKHEKVLIMPHKSTDIDALGASIGLLQMALAQKKDARIVLDFDGIDQTCQKVMNMLSREYVKLMEYFIEPEDALNEITPETLLFVVDHHSPTQSNAPKLLEHTKYLIVIDHHRRIDNLLSDVMLTYMEPYASSSVELVIEMVELYNHEVDIDPFEATIMLAGMMIDTNNFTYRTGVRTFEAAALLKRYGADPFKARLILRESLDHIKTKSNLVNRAKIINNRFAIAMLPPENQTDRVQLARTADELLEIDNIVGAFAIGDIGNDTIAISARSVDKFNVQMIMEQFGGGGHLNNAAAQVENGDVVDIAKKIETILETTFKEELTMKIILVKDVRGKGKRNDIIEVASGYGNYLLSSKQAIDASPANLRALEEEKAKQERLSELELEEAQKMKEEIENSPIKIFVKIGESGKLFGAVSSKQIADEYKREYNIDLDKRKIVLDNNIHSLGVFKVPVKLHKDVTANISLQVLEEEA